MGTNIDGGKFKRQIYDRSLLDSSIMGTLSIKLAKSWRNPEYDRECVKHSPRISALISTAKFQRFRRSLYRALLTKNRKTSWVAASSVHPRRRAHTRRAPVFPRAPVLSFHLPPIRRINALWLPFMKDASRIPTAFRPDAPAGSGSSIQDVRAITGRVDESEKKVGSESVCCSSIAISLTQNYRFGANISHEITLKLNTMLRLRYFAISEREICFHIHMDC